MGAREAHHGFADDLLCPCCRSAVLQDLQIQASRINLPAAGSASICRFAVSGLSAEPRCCAVFAAWQARARTVVSVPDPHYRATLWQDPGDAHAPADPALPLATVAVGNRTECDVAVGGCDPDRPTDLLLDNGFELAVVKQGAKGVLARTRYQAEEVEPPRVQASGRALCHELPAARLLERVLTFVNCRGVIVASRRERPTAMPTDCELKSAWVRIGDPTMRPWPLATWPPNWCMEVRHE